VTGIKFEGLDLVNGKKLTILMKGKENQKGY
jgi:hypothetical protein